MNKSVCRISKDGDKSWWADGVLHRIDGPAVEMVYGYKAWYINHKRHREDGPAQEWPDGAKRWWLNGVELKCSTQEEFLQLVKLKAFW